MTAQETLQRLRQGLTLTALGQFDHGALRLLALLEKQGKIESGVSYTFPNPKKTFYHNPERCKPLPAAVSF